MNIAKKLESWYHINKRILPWRETKDPYRIWLSEVIMQQTQIRQGLPYYERFVKAFPTLKHLANASEHQVLKLWEGLGYYSRARNLHTAAKQLTNEYNGTFPKTYDALLKIKGIGPYTAAAISSICFDVNVGVVDGNVYRVLSRLFGIDTPINTSTGQKEFNRLAQKLITEASSPGDYNQAIMEFGATHCTPKSPDCATCMFATNCTAFTTGTVSQLPKKEKAKPIKTRYLNYLIYVENGEIAVSQRQAGDIWAGLYDFPLIETSKSATPATLVKAASLTAEVKRISGPEKHMLTHQRLWLTFWQTKALPKMISKDIKMISIKGLSELAMPIVIKRFVESNLLLLPTV